MAEHDVKQLKLRTYSQSFETKLGVEFYTTDDPPEIKALQDLTETEAIAVRDFLNAQYPAS